MAHGGESGDGGMGILSNSVMRSIDFVEPGFRLVLHVYTRRPTNIGQPEQTTERSEGRD